jgi:DNA segregation ATPase FtsK/SpoIIIE-like protein
MKSLKTSSRSSRSLVGSAKKSAKSTAKKATKGAKTKKASKASVAKANANTTSHGMELLGLFLLAIAVVSAISLISDFATGSRGNILGAYVGVWWSHFLNQMAGRLPAALLLVTVGVLGVELARTGSRERPEEGLTLSHFKLSFVVGLLYAIISVLLSVKYMGVASGSLDVYQQSGGVFGNFLVHQFLVPLFGTNTFGPYLLSSIALFFTIAWGFKLSIATVLEKAVEFGGIFLYPIADGLETVRERWREKRDAKLEARALELEEQQNQVVQAQRAAKQAKVAKATKATKESAVSQEDPSDVQNLDPTSVPLDIEEEDFDPNDPLSVRKKRDRDAEKRRVAELNEWEVQQRQPKLAGMITKKDQEDAIAREGMQDRTPEVSEIDGLQQDIQQLAEGQPSQASQDQQQEEVTEVESEAIQEELPPAPEVKYDEYVIPDIHKVLEDSPEQTIDYSEDELTQQAQALEEQLANFKVMGKVVGICTGPVIIRYEVELAPGVKVSRIANLSDDLALALKAKSIRILAPIPGKSAVGIEVPNRKSQIVFIKDVLASKEFAAEEDTIKLVLGKDIAGEPSVMDLAKAPHLLIAGQTGSGKSVCINSFMASILLSKSPDEVRMILVDPKVVELKPYDSIPHLLAPVVTQPEIAVQALQWSTFEMDRRYNVLAQVGARNIKGYNQKFRNGDLEGKVAEEDNKLMPYIVIVIDELADLMMVAGKEVETNIARIAQKARAVGIHLILATQRPSTNVITGTIKANLPTRIAFQVASQIDARTIMDKAGAEKLLGRGDMLYRSIDSPEPERMHGSFVGDDQAEAMAKVCAEQFVNYPHISSFDVTESVESEMEDIPRDAKFRDAAELVCSLRQASVSLLQRRMSIGYARAGRIVDQLERAGIVGRDRGSKPREVLMDELELASFLSSGLND